MGRYRSMSGSWIDPEKQQIYHDFDESDTSTASPASDPYAPILARNGRPAKRAYHLPRQQFGRYFTFTISALLLLFMFFLVRSSWVSQAELIAGVHKRPPPPAAWEQFPFLKRYHGGIRTLVSRQNNKPEYPVDEDQEAERLRQNIEAQNQEAGEDDFGEKSHAKRDQTLPHSQRFDPFRSQKSLNDSVDDLAPLPCYLNEETKLMVPQLLAYNGVPRGFPDPIIGSYDLLDLRNDMCFERYGRLGPYGFGYSQKFGGTGAGMDGEREGSEEVWGEDLEIDYRNVKWGAAQERCAKKNARRFRTNTKQALNHFSMPTTGAGVDIGSRYSEQIKREIPGESIGPQLNRTAILIRTWLGYEYDAEDIFYLRALVNELSLQSGSEYIVHFLIHVKEDDMEIWSDEATYQQVLEDALPTEFRGMGTLWSEKQMALVYSGVATNFYRDLPVHGVYRSTFMPVQYFAHTHPEYAFYWNWEMDTRYTGHFAHLFKQVSQWAKQQPRKGLWERNGRFYIPSEHGSWDDFRHLVRVQTEHGTASKQNIYGKLSTDAGADSPSSNDRRRLETPVWGPLPATSDEESTTATDFDQQPLTSYEKDAYEWGVGEEADLITFNPLFDPQDTNWLLASDVTGYNTTEGLPPRRAAIITASRLSYRLLETMHRETSVKHHTMFSEMWPASCALHHGFKAVYAPHPVYVDRAWPTSYLAAVFNNGRNGAAGGARTSVFSDERQHNFRGTTWYYNSGFGPNLWKRWLGYKVDNDGGEEWEMANEGRMCLPAMLLHPVKHVDMVYEHEEGETGLY